MPVLPFAVAALSLIWFSLSGAEPILVDLWALAVPFIAAIVLAFLWQPIGPQKCKSLRARRTNGLMGLICLVVFVSVPLTHWPLRLAYQSSRSSFDNLAQSLQAGDRFQKPMRVGWFTIQKAEIYQLNGKICLWTNLKSSGNTGFTMCPPNDVPFNLQSIIELDKNWQFISED